MERRQIILLIIGFLVMIQSVIAVNDLIDSVGAESDPFFRKFGGKLNSDNNWTGENYFFNLTVVNYTNFNVTGNTTSVAFCLNDICITNWEAVNVSGDGLYLRLDGTNDPTALISFPYGINVSGNATFNGSFSTTCLHCEDGDTYFHGAGFFEGNVTAPNIEVMESLIVHGNSSCTGTAVPCNDAMFAGNPALCGYTIYTGQRGCVWRWWLGIGADCYGTATPCEDMSTASCEEQHTCTLNTGATGFIIDSLGLSGNFTINTTGNISGGYIIGDGSHLINVNETDPLWTANQTGGAVNFGQDDLVAAEIGLYGGDIWNGGALYLYLPADNDDDVEYYLVDVVGDNMRITTDDMDFTHTFYPDGNVSFDGTITSNYIISDGSHLINVNETDPVWLSMRPDYINVSRLDNSSIIRNNTDGGYVGIFDYIGIGTSTPNQELEVKGNVNISENLILNDKVKRYGVWNETWYNESGDIIWEKGYNGTAFFEIAYG